MNQKISNKFSAHRPLYRMSIDQERLYHASRIIEGVSSCLLDYASCAGEIHLYDLMELVGRLDLAVDAMRKVNGASDLTH